MEMILTDDQSVECVDIDLRVEKTEPIGTALYSIAAHVYPSRIRNALF